jgi:hypothetical protein
VTFDPLVLFETTMSPPTGGPYPTYLDELDATRAGQKGMTAFFWTREFVTDDGSFVIFAEQIFDRGLTLVLDPDEVREKDRRHQQVTAFALQPDQLWRVPAYRAHDDTRGTRTEASTRMQSHLLGYTEAQTRKWLAFERWREPERGHGVFALLTRDERARVDGLGRTSFGAPEDIAGMELFRHGRGHMVKRTAARLVPRGLTLARAGLSPWPFSRSSGRPVIDRWTVMRKVAPRVSAALCTQVEFLGARGWR